MTITLNGQPHPTEASTIGQLLTELGLNEKPVVIEHNQTALLKHEHPTTPLSDSDQLEIITLAAGG
ncbi:MAG: sulfur carrier protein ThiS [Verrucomicrobiota bacterium]